MADDIKDRLLKLETELPYIRGELNDLWTAVTPIVREIEEYKTEMVRYLYRIENTEKGVLALTTTTEKHITSLSDSIKELTTTMQSYAESIKFLVTVRKNLNTIFVALIIQAILFISSLLAFVFIMVQKNNVQSSPQQMFNPPSISGKQSSGGNNQ